MLAANIEADKNSGIQPAGAHAQHVPPSSTVEKPIEIKIEEQPAITRQEEEEAESDLDADYDDDESDFDDSPLDFVRTAL